VLARSAEVTSIVSGTQDNNAVLAWFWRDKTLQEIWECAANLLASYGSIEGIIIAFKDDEACHVQAAKNRAYIETRRNALLDYLTTVERRLVQV
jgi:hypothetical protein